MDLFTIYPWNYEKAAIIDEYESVIWTERFIEPGDIRLVLPATKDTPWTLMPGSLVGRNNSREIMLIDTRSIQNGLATFTGKTIDGHFNEQFIGEGTITATPGAVLKEIVRRMQARWAGDNKIQDLVLGSVADLGNTNEVEEDISFGPAGAELVRIATKYSIGMGVYRTRTESGLYVLEFSTRVGTDLRDQIIFSPDLDNLANVKELVSDVNSKEVVISHPPKDLAISKYAGTIRADNLPGSVPFVRVLELTNDDITYKRLGMGDHPPEWNGWTTTEYIYGMGKLKAIMRKRARDKLRHLKKTKAVDGEITPETQYKYYTEPNPYGDIEYRVGDKVKIDGHYSNPIDGIVTEYIQSSDATGERGYPTVAPAADEGVSNPGNGYQMNPGE